MTDDTGGVVRVVIVDDHALIRDAVRMALAEEPRISVIGEARTGAEALSIVRLTDPDVVVLDYRLPDANAPEIMAALRDRGSRAEIVVLTGYGERRNVRSAVDQGARAFLTKRATDLAALAESIIDASNGVETLSDDALSALVSSVRHECEGLKAEPTPRECEIWRLVAEGLSNAEIARRLYLSERTVKYHVGHLLEKTGARRRAELVAIAFREGLMDTTA